VNPQARRFTELGVTSSAPLPALEQVTQLPRKLEPPPADPAGTE
jgi:hypothetical protein